jgi:polysaccharide deacetylase family protein (PEP-CTERM system associated)
VSLLSETTIVNALSVDVEEYFHASIFQAGTCGQRAARFESRVEGSVDRLLALLGEAGARATFFTLGEIARAHPAIVRRIAAARHEVACHGERHRDVWAQTPRQFRRDLRRSRSRLEDLAGAAVVGYRAPNFSIGPAQSWAYPILLEEGFRYDSSVYPIFHDRYGAPRTPRFPYAVFTSGSAALTEFPIGTARLFGINFPVGGGGYFRLSPFELVRRGIQRVNVRERRPIMFYVHPWEIDPGQPRPAMPWHCRFRHYVGMERHAAKLACLLARFCFGTARDVLQSQQIVLPDAVQNEVSIATV